MHWSSGLYSLPRSTVVPPELPIYRCETAQSTSHYLDTCPLFLGFPSPPLLPVWMNVSSLTLWLLDFPTVQFSGTSVCFFVFKFVVLLSVVRGSKAYLPMPQSWPEVPSSQFLNIGCKVRGLASFQFYLQSLFDMFNQSYAFKCK